MLDREIILKVSKEIQIEEIVRHYVDLYPRGRNFSGSCPFCKSKTAFIVSPYKNIFKCFSCQLKGNLISFIMKYENMTYPESIEFILIKFSNTLNLPENFSPDPIKGDIYVLQLVDNCYYIGFTRDIAKRLKDHFRGEGSVWTKKHKPVQVVEYHISKTLNYENYLTEKYIEKYGYDFVRGGDHIYFKKKFERLI